MKLNKIFKQAVLGLALTAGVASVAQAANYIEIPNDGICQVIETSSRSGKVFYDYDKELIVAINGLTRGFRSEAAPPSMHALRAEELDFQQRDKYEQMKQYLSPVCKQKLGVF